MKIEKNKIVIYLAVLLAVQILIYVLFNIFSSQNLKSREIDKPLLSGLKKDNVMSLEIKDSTGSFSIEKKDGKWAINTGSGMLPGDVSKIDPYIDQLVKLQSGVVVYNGSDASSDKTFGFAEKMNQLLVVKTKNMTYRISIGNPGSKRTSSYIKYNNEKKVREVSSNIASSTSNTPSMWAVKNIFEAIKFEDVTSCEFDSSFDWFKGNYKIISNGLSGKDMKISIEPALNKELQDYALENAVRSILNLTVSDYKLEGGIEGKAKTGGLKIITRDRKEISADVYKADVTDPGNYIVKTSETDYLYLISEDMAKSLFKNTRDFLKETAK